jgi:hypothetical protein
VETIRTSRIFTTISRVNLTNTYLGLFVISTS